MNHLSATGHPLSKSGWIWPCGNLYLQNCHAQFRYDFELETIPAAAPFFVTADQSYRLYINGRYVCRGPARGYQESWPFDEIDVVSFLQKGHNWISAEAYNPGVGTFQYIYQSMAGFLCAADWGNIKINTSRNTWQMRLAPANRRETARLSIQMGFQEDFDASADDSRWITSPEKPEGWEMSEADFAISEIPFGRPPWVSVEARGIPMLREELIAPAGISVYGCGKMKDGWRDCRNIAWHWPGDEEQSIKEWKKGAELSPSIAENELKFSVPAAQNEEFYAVCIDLGAIRAGCFYLSLDNCSGNEIADCLFYQYLKDGIPETRIPVSNGGQLALATRLRTAAGHCERWFYDIYGARYIVLILRGFRKSVNIKTSWRTAEYPFTMRGEFKTSDSELNAIYDLCRHTQQICSLDAYVDTPWREQGQWWADARVQARNTFYLDGDTRLLRRGIDSVAGQRTSQGLVSGVAPCRAGGCAIPDFALVWVLTVWDHYQQTGTLEAFEHNEHRVREVMSYFELPENRGKDGLLKFDPCCWLFEDWASLPKNGYPAYLNFFYLYTLIHYEKLLRLSGRITEADKYAEICRERAELMEKYFFDEQEGLFIAGLDFNGKPNAVPSLHDQALAILCGLRPDSWTNMREKRFLPFLRGEKVEFAVPTSYWCFYMFEAAKKLSVEQEVIEFIRKKWSRMIPYGGTWEHLELDEAVGQSCCHGWSAHPAVYLIDYLLGLQQLAPAWREISISPKTELLPESGTIRIPLPPGDLVFKWNNGKWDIEYPGKYKLEHCCPVKNQHKNAVKGSGCSG